MCLKTIECDDSSYDCQTTIAAKRGKQYQHVQSETKKRKKLRILGECLLIHVSSLQGMALRTFVDIARLAERFNMRSQSVLITSFCDVTNKACFWRF